MLFYYAECHIYFTIMLNVIMLSVVVLNVIMLSVVAAKNHAKLAGFRNAKYFSCPLKPTNLAQFFAIV